MHSRTHNLPGALSPEHCSHRAGQPFNLWTPALGPHIGASPPPLEDPAGHRVLPHLAFSPSSFSTLITCTVPFWDLPLLFRRELVTIQGPGTFLDSSLALHSPQCIQIQDSGLLMAGTQTPQDDRYSEQTASATASHSCTSWACFGLRSTPSHQSFIHIHTSSLHMHSQH